MSEGPYVGVDLAVRRPSAIAAILNNKVSLELATSTEDIVKAVGELSPRVVAIDSPLTLSSSSYRDVDLQMIRMGLRVLPISWRSMRLLAEKGISIASLLRSAGFRGNRDPPDQRAEN